MAGAAAPVPPPPATDVSIDDTRVISLLNSSGTALLVAMRERRLRCDHIVMDFTRLSKTWWITPEHAGFPLSVAAAFYGVGPLRDVLANGGDPNARTTCGFSAVMAPLVNRDLCQRDREDVLRVSCTVARVIWLR